MNGKQIGGIACLLLSVLFLIVGIKYIVQGTGPDIADESGVGVSYAVGAFLPCVLFAALGLWLLQKARGR